MTTTIGTPTFPLVDMMRDTIATHGLAWSVRYYSARMPMWQARFFLRAAYLGV